MGYGACLCLRFPVRPTAPGQCPSLLPQHLPALPPAACAASCAWSFCPGCCSPHHPPAAQLQTRRLKCCWARRTAVWCAPSVVLSSAVGRGVSASGINAAAQCGALCALCLRCREAGFDDLTNESCASTFECARAHSCRHVQRLNEILFVPKHDEPICDIDATNMFVFRVAPEMKANYFLQECRG